MIMDDLYSMNNFIVLCLIHFKEESDWVGHAYGHSQDAMWTLQVTNHKTSPVDLDIITYLVQEVWWIQKYLHKFCLKISLESSLQN